MRLRWTKYPLVRQYDRLDCGPAALLSVLRFHGGDAGLAQIRAWCNTDLNGTTMLDMVTAGRRLGFQARGVRGSFDELRQQPLPCIAHVLLADGSTHYLVIYKIDKERLYVGDPAKGRSYLSRTEFEALWAQRCVILLQPNGQSNEQSNSQPTGCLLRQRSQSWIGWLGGYLQRQSAWLMQILFSGFLYTALGLGTLLIIQTLIDRLIPAADFHNLLFLALLLTLLLGLRTVLGYLRDRFLVVANKNLSRGATDDFIEHLFHLAKPFFDTRKTGDITARINDSLQIYRAGLFILQSALLDSVMVIGGLVFMFYFSTWLGWITLAPLPAYVWLLWRQSRPIREQQRSVMKAHATLESVYINSIQNIDEIAAMATAPAYVRLNQAAFADFQTHVERLGNLQARLTALISAMGALISIALLTAGAALVMDRQMLLGRFIAAYSLLSWILPSIQTLVSGLVEFQAAQVAAQRMMDLLSIETERNEGSVTLQGATTVHVDRLAFAYAKSSPLLQDVSLTIPAGRITSLWGPSGAGKSTLVQLLQRRYPPLSGEIRFNDIRSVDLELTHLRSRIGVVPQSIRVFNASLAENILLGRYAAGLPEIEERLAGYGLAMLSRRFELGLATLLGEEGRRLSGGELELLGLARALFAGPALLIIDEGFSAVDVALQRALGRVIRSYSRQHAVLLITHNLQTLRETDYLYMLVQGRIVQQGEPQALLRDPGLFKELFPAMHPFYQE